MKKYELTTETEIVGGIILYRIRALRDIPLHHVKAGDLGGWIESERNLSQQGDCWVGENACICGDAVISEHALVEGKAQIYGNARVSHFAQINGDTHVSGDVSVSGASKIGGNSKIVGFK